MDNINSNFFFLSLRSIVSNKICFSSTENGDAIANVFIVWSRFCFSNSFQLTLWPSLANNDFKFLNISFKSENLISSFFSFKSDEKLSKCLKKDIWWSAKTCLKHKLVDEII